MKVIGLSGLAGSGKDLFYELCSEELKKKNHTACQIALATDLKIECRDALITMFGIDPTACTREEKNKIRDFLVFFGHFRRRGTLGQYWMQKANNKIKSLKRNCTINNIKNPTCFVTDIRYDEYEPDEADWVKAKHKGTLVHLRKRRIVLSETGKRKDVYEEAINKHEKENDPKLREKADVCIEWPNCNGQENLIKKHLKPVIKQFVKKYITN